MQYKILNIKAKFAQNLIDPEFNEIKAISNFLVGYTCDAQSEIEKNRYANVLAYDHSRVPLVDGKYINASFYTNGENKYILAQDPMLEYLEDFWEMIYHHSNIVIALTNSKEISTNHGNNTDYLYLLPRKFGDYDVLKLSEEIHSGNSGLPVFIHSKISITFKGNSKTIDHILFLDWTMNDIPEMESFIALHTWFRKIRKPTDVVTLHCSAGIGRTGTFCLTDVMVNKIYQNDFTFDFKGVLVDIRKARGYCVRTLEQYEYAHKVVLYYLEHFF